MLKLAQIAQFAAVADQGSIRAGARHLGLAQPALTRAIQDLERTLGATLFLREARGVVLTAAGAAFLERARVILGDVRRAEEAVRQLAGGIKGELRIGLSIAAQLSVLPAVLPRFRRRFPDVRLTIVEGFLPTLERDLRNGLTDLYIGPAYDGEVPGDLRSEFLFENERLVMGRRGHPLEGARDLPDLDGTAWLTTSITHSAGDELGQIFAARGLPPPRLAARCQSALSILSVLLRSDLLAMLPRQWTDAPGLGDGLAAFLPGRSFPAPPIHLVQRQGLGLTPAGEHFADLVRITARPAE